MPLPHLQPDVSNASCFTPLKRPVLASQKPTDPRLGSFLTLIALPIRSLLRRVFQRMGGKTKGYIGTSAVRIQDNSAACSESNDSDDRLGNNDCHRGNTLALQREASSEEGELRGRNVDGRACPATGFPLPFPYQNERICRNSLACPAYRASPALLSRPPYFSVSSATT